GVHRDCGASLCLRVSDADDQGGACGFDDVVGDGVQLVNLHDAFHLGEESVDEAEVAPGDAGDRGDSLGVGVVVGLKGLTEFAPASFQDKAQFFLGQGAVFVGEADSAVELGVAAELFFDAGHTNQNQPDIGAVVAISEVFDRTGTQAFGFIDDNQVNIFSTHFGWPGEFAEGFEMLVNADCDTSSDVSEVV